ncbi:MAG: hypothetical protein ACLFQK_06900 [Fibrobacterota bacterium]
MEFIQKKASEKEVEVYTTDMFDAFFRPHHCGHCTLAIQNPEKYMFLDISQINSRYFGEEHWDTLMMIKEMVAPYKTRPLNCTKVYGGGESSWGSGKLEDGVERFCRDIIGGCASARFHRPKAGNGLNEKAKGAIRAFRKLETVFSVWEVKPDNSILTGREKNEAYCSVLPGKYYAVYFPAGGAVDLKKGKGEYSVKWISIKSGKWGPEEKSGPGESLSLNTPDEYGWLAVVYR